MMYKPMSHVEEINTMKPSEKIYQRAQEISQIEGAPPFSSPELRYVIQAIMEYLDDDS